MPDLQDRVVLVTGGSTGIGRAVVHRLAAGGARVVACARDRNRLTEALAGVDGATGAPADVRSPTDRVALVQRVLAEHGRLDAVVLNAGIGYAGLVEDTPQEAVETMIATNLTGVVDLARLALPHLLAAAAERGRADVLVTASAAALSQVPPLAVYSATKAGAHGFVKGLRREVTARGVRVHSIAPGPVSTEWLVRGRGEPPVSDEDAEGRLSPGIRTERVADQVARSLGSYWSRTVSVPRWMGLARLGEVPPVDRVLDMTLSRQAARIRRVTDRMVAERDG
ncbi:SDR family oxidoreductase [Blastococcus sp. MG754426]|uniref:SDR family oxidoreductase n=1 Tax=unclassified Blastococcus TaxID=2619396 RepID=UPI001EF0E6C4|nr:MULTISPECIES: SDR family oxidoreductase [unclassified Blastococcus]MCF6508062.1 SDR family oxidoreductase [Blastococcus sp. MG754426]MCF6512831.1 SDR family oxidoreductase [Blastococcus sp. MG754427]MCF6736242.1 SDR family oxidoreductase [Blastococcus sp. KM273129]